MEASDMAERMAKELKDEGVEVTTWGHRKLEKSDRADNYYTYKIFVAYKHDGQERYGTLLCHEWDEWLTPLAEDFKMAIRRHIDGNN